MRRFLLTDIPETAQSSTLHGKDARYLSRVLRLGPGDTFPAMFPSGLRCQCTILEVHPGGIRIALDRIFQAPENPGIDRGTRIEEDPDDGNTDRRAAADLPDPTVRVDAPAPTLILAQGLAKGSKMDTIIRQATEAGVHAIIPLRTQYSLSGLAGGSDHTAKVQRWERIVREALQQSGSPVPTRLLQPASPAELPGRIAALDCAASGWRGLLFHESALDSPPLHRYLADNPGTIVLCIGPEGGFAPEETATLQAAGFGTVHFRIPILRTETAAIYAIAAVSTISMERPAWNPA